MRFFGFFLGFYILASTASAANILPLRHGFYVESDVPCSAASAPLTMLYDGKFLRRENANCTAQIFRKISKNTYHLTQRCQSLEVEKAPWTPMSETYNVIDTTNFTVTDIVYDELMEWHYRYCAKSALPRPYNETSFAE